MVTTVRLKGDLGPRLRRLAQETGHSQSYYINQMIAGAIDRLEWEYRILHDVEEHRAKRLETVSHDDLKANLGLAD